MKIKMPCFHKNMEYLCKDKVDNKYRCHCQDCDKIMYRKKEIPCSKHARTNYSWCNCGNDLIRDSYIGEEKDLIPGLQVLKYVCSECNEVSYWTFDIGICGIKLEFNEDMSEWKAL